MEDYAIILDYLPYGYMDENKSSKNKPIAQALGTKNFSLLELTPKENIDLELFETVFIGVSKRDKIDRVKGKLISKNLTTDSVLNIDYVIKKLILANEEEYVKFFNSHPLVLSQLREVGRKVNVIVEEIEKSPFKSFSDMESRISFFSDTEDMIKNKIKQELGIEKNYRKNKRSSYNKEVNIFTKNLITKEESSNKRNKGKKNKSKKNNKVKNTLKKENNNKNKIPDIHKNINVNLIDNE